MVDAVGTLAKMGIKAGVVWDTDYSAVDVAIPFLSEGLSAEYTRIQKNSLLGYGGREPSEQGNLGISESTNHELDYNNFTRFFKAAFGAEAGAVFTIIDQNPYCIWMEFEKQISRHRFGAAKASKMTISGEQGGIVELVMEWFARSFENSATAFPSITPLAMTKVRFQDLVFRIADQINAITANDTLEIDQFEFSFERPLKADDYVARASNQQLAIEPVESDFRNVQLSIRVPRYTSDILIDWKEADTPLQADLTFTRGGESIKLELPELRISDGFGASVGGPSPMILEGTFDAFRSITGNPMYVGNEAKITVT